MSKRKVLSVTDKVAIIKEAETGVKNVAICKKYGLSSSTVSTLLKNKESLLRAFERNITTSKRLKKCEKADLDEALFKWYIFQQNSGLSTSGPVMRMQAEKFAFQLGYENFSCTNGWLHRFRMRHNILSRKKNGEMLNESSLCLDTVLSDSMKESSFCLDTVLLDSKKESSMGLDTVLPLHTVEVIAVKNKSLEIETLTPECITEIEKQPLPSVAEATDCVETLQCFFEAAEHRDSEVLNALSVIRRKIWDLKQINKAKTKRTIIDCSLRRNST